MGSWLDRYMKGDCVQVWTEMTGAGEDIRENEDTADDARAVVGETMRRARRNVERLVDLLPRIGYRFDDRAGLPVFAPPEPDVDDRLVELEARIGTIPLALRVWYEQVGRVNLTGRHPAWTFELFDPLVVDAPIPFVLSEFDDWVQDRGTEWDRGRFVIDIAPDFLHKANVSGGAPYSLAVPNRGVDGLLLHERHQTTFVNYLRISFRWAGFPGWDRGSLDGWASPAGPPPAELSEIAAALEPL